jgi:hypothetical protein
VHPFSRSARRNTSFFSVECPIVIIRIASRKKKLKNSGRFLDAKKRLPKHHNLPATHHNFTTKTPRKNTIFRQNPLQKRPSTTKIKNP